MAQKKQENRPNFSPAIVGAGAAAAVVALWFGYPGFLVLYLAVIGAGWTIVPPQLTGKKDENGYPTAAHPGETKRMNTYRFWSDVKWRMFTPTFDWSPISYKKWSPLLSWFAAVWASLFAFLFLPMAENPGGAEVSITLPGFLLPAINALALFVVVAQVAASRRRYAVAGDPCPGLRLDSLVGLFKKDAPTNLIHTYAFAVAGTVAGLVVGFVLEPQLAGTHPVRWLLFAVAGFTAGLFQQWNKAALQVWRDTAAARAEWEPRWTELKLQPAPFLSEYKKFGPATVESFIAPASMGAEAFSALSQKLVPYVGVGSRIAFLEVPNTDSQGQPQQGTRHPTNFQFVTYNSEEVPDLADPNLDPEEAKLLLRCAMVWAADANGYPRAILNEMEVISPDDAEMADLVTPERSNELFEEGDESDQDRPPAQGPVQIPAVPRSWRTTWVALDGPSMRNFMAPALSNELACEVLVDHRAGGNGIVFIGDLTRDDSLLSRTSGVTVKQMKELASEDMWNKKWEEVSKRGANPPVIQHQFYQESKLADGTVIYQQPFVARQGIDPMEYMEYPAKLATALNSAPFVAITGWTRAQGSRPGDRHAQAICVHWAHSPVPANPDQLQPGPRDAARWVLSGRMNEAFVAARLARPEVVRVRELTSAESRGHIWEIVLRLYGGVSLADVRGASQRIRQALGSEWLRVANADDGIVIVAGISPKKAKLAKPRRDEAYIAALDWEQAWLDSKISGVGGLTPVLKHVGCLPKNEKVQVLDFELPSGLDFSTVKSASKKLENATANSFVDVRRIEGKANMVRLLVCEVNPLPETTGFDFDIVDETEGIAFATGIEGEPVVFNPLESPHSLLAGVTGSGKSVLAQNFLYGFLSKGAEVYVVDAVKGAADFQFAKEHAIALATTAFEAAGVMKHIYGEVVKRKNANAAAGVGSYIDLPNPPPPLVVLIDEFTSLLGMSLVPKQSDDPSMDIERDAIIAENNARIEIGVYAGKLAREARSAGVTLLLGTQKLSAKMLDSIPGGGDLKTNLARVLLGKASSGDRMSALRAFDDAPILQGDIPKGRGLWEPLTSSAMTIQCWYASQSELSANLHARRPPLPLEQRLDLSRFEPVVLTGPGTEFRPRPTPAAAPEAIVELPELVFSLDDLDTDEFEDDEDEDTAATIPALEVPVPDPMAEFEADFAAQAAAQFTEDPTDAFDVRTPQILELAVPEPVQPASADSFSLDDLFDAPTIQSEPAVPEPVQPAAAAEPDDPFAAGLPKVAPRFLDDNDPFA